MSDHHWYEIPYHVQHSVIIMVATAGSWFNGLSETKKQVWAVGAILLFGVGIGMSFTNIIGVPGDVDDLKRRVTAQEEITAAHQRQIDDANEQRDYLVRLAEWTTCALSAHNAEESVLTICGAEPHRYITRYTVPMIP